MPAYAAVTVADDRGHAPTTRTATTRTVTTRTTPHAGPHESPPLITVPLIILAAFALLAGYLNAAPFEIEKFTEWVAPALDEHPLPRTRARRVRVDQGGALDPARARRLRRQPRRVPRRSTAASAPRCRASPDASRRCGGATRSSRTSTTSTYLYEKVIVHGIAYPISAGAYWFNQNVIDAHRQQGRHRRASSRRLGLSQHRSARRRRRCQRIGHRHGGRRSGAAADAVRQGQPIRGTALRSRRHRRPRSRHRQHLRSLTAMDVIRNDNWHCSRSARSCRSPACS